MQHVNAFDPSWVRRNLALTLVASLAVTNAFIILPDEESKPFFSNWTINAAAAVALGMVIIVIWSQKLDGLHGRTYAAFAIGLALWLVAEILWTYYELYAEIDPYPSAADAFWIAGYAPFSYHLISTYRFFGQAVKPYVIIIVSIAAALFVGHTSTIVYTTSSPVTPDDFTTAGISIAYLALDAVLVVPAIIVLASLRRGKLTFTPWFLLSSALLITAAADSGFAYYEAAGMEEEIWIWNPLYNSSYIIMTATLFWHYRFFVFHEREARRIWQEENR
jgi:hypothetical protein